MKTSGVKKLFVLRAFALSLVVSMLLSTVVLFGGSVIAQTVNTGSVWTTDIGCAQVNGNIFLHKSDVYLNGGPKNSQNSGLPDGSYFIQVTEPGGLLLGKSDPQTVTVSGGKLT